MSERHLRFSPLVKDFSKYLTDLHKGEQQLSEILLSESCALPYNQFVYPQEI